MCTTNKCALCSIQVSAALSALCSQLPAEATAAHRQKVKDELGRLVGRLQVRSLMRPCSLHPLTLTVPPAIEQGLKRKLDAADAKEDTAVCRLELRLGSLRAIAGDDDPPDAAAAAAAAAIRRNWGRRRLDRCARAPLRRKCATKAASDRRRLRGAGGGARGGAGASPACPRHRGARSRGARRARDMRQAGCAG
jgi:hypothetical protein